MATQKQILVVRLSSMGDVAMAVPTVAAVAQQHERIRLTVLTDSRYAPLFSRLSHVDVVGIDLKQYGGLFGLFRLFRELKALKKWDAVVDLHNVIRSKILRSFFYLAGVPSSAVRKNRPERRKLIARRNKCFVPLQTVQRQHRDAFVQLGISVHEQRYSIFPPETPLSSEQSTFTGKTNGKWLGIAPFARYKGKIYPPDKMETVVRQLAANPDLTIFLFGNGEKEIAQLESWEKAYPNVHSIAGKISLLDELKVMTHLDGMIVMDSANMHLASLVHIPVISVWGQTHPYAGFFGNGQSENHTVQVSLPCRPCSIYGNKNCYIGGFPCLNQITPEMLVEMTEKVLNLKPDSR